MRAVFIFDYPVSERDARRCGFALLRRNGFEVDVWDTTPVLHPGVHRQVTVPDPLESVPVRRFHSSREIRAALGALPASAFLFLVVYYQLGSVPLYRTVGRLKLRYGVIVANALPRPAMPSGTDAVLKRLARLRPRTLAWHAVRRIPQRWLGVPPATLVVAGGEESLASQDGFYPVAPASHVVWAHSHDYDHYLEEQQTARTVDPAQAVFLDEYLPFHPDYEYLRIDPPSTADAYYPRLRAYFDYLERTHGVRVVIAAHPRAEYERHPDYFGGRPVVRGRTPELVRSSGFVIAHSSTSLNYAVMFEHPVVFVTTDAIEASAYLGRYIADLAARFGSPRLNLDRAESTWCAAQPVDIGAYHRYRAAYIKKPGSPEQLMWRIVGDELTRRAVA